jgi:hypothetical protein
MYGGHMGENPLDEDSADAQAARESLAELKAGAEPVPAEQVWAELDIGE